MLKNREVVEKFINEIPGSNRNVTSTGTELWNYRTLIALNQNRTIYLNTEKYSQTTSTIQNMVRNINKEIGRYGFQEINNEEELKNIKI
jgi:L,D-peptidoglycan transpeptidase YkuD (ErfK/YbiS/YcfS/YnhG family)